MTAWNLFSYETRAPITVTKLMLINFRHVQSGCGQNFPWDYKLQPHYTKIPRSDPGLSSIVEIIDYIFKQSKVPAWGML